MNTNKLARDILFYFVILIGVLGLIYTYRLLIRPLVIAVLLAYLLHPGVNWISEHIHLKRRYVVPVVYIVFVAVLGIIIIYLSPIIVQQAKILSFGLQTVPNQIGKFERDVEILFGFELPILAFWDDIQSGAYQLLKPERVFQIIRITTTNIVWLVVIFATSFYLLRDWERLRDWVIDFAPEEDQPDILHLYQEIKVIWQIFLRGQLLIMLLVGLLSGLGAAVIGLPGAIILGILAGTLALIPTLGPATATVIVAIVAWTHGSTYLEISNAGMVILAVATFQAVQIIEGVWLTPQIMGKRLQLHPGLLLIAIIGTLVTVGAMMALIISPLIGSMEIIIRYIRRKRAGLELWPLDDSHHVAGDGWFDITSLNEMAEDIEVT